MWIHWPFFPKTWTKGHWPLDDLWVHVCWGHMCDSTQGSLCPSPMTIHQCMCIQWSILQNTTYIHIHTHTTYIHIHTTYRMSDHIVSYWTQFRRDKKGRGKKIEIISIHLILGQLFLVQLSLLRQFWLLCQNQWRATVNRAEWCFLEISIFEEYRHQFAVHRILAQILNSGRPWPKIVLKLYLTTIIINK